MREMKTVVIALLACTVCCMPFSAAQANNEAAKSAPEAKSSKFETAKPAASAKAVKNDAAKINNAVKVLKEIAAIQKRKIPPQLIAVSTAVVIVPKASKHNFMVSGGSSGGVLLLHDKTGKWSNPLFVTLTGGTLGWQIVGDPLDIVIVYKNMKSVDELLKGKLIMNAKTAIEPGPLGPTMKGASTAAQKADIVSYVRSHGVFEDEATVTGSTVQIDNAANDAFYATLKVVSGDIVSGKVSKSSEDIAALQKLLAEYATGK